MPCIARTSLLGIFSAASYGRAPRTLLTADNVGIELAPEPATALAKCCRPLGTNCQSRPWRCQCSVACDPRLSSLEATWLGDSEREPDAGNTLISTYDCGLNGRTARNSRSDRASFPGNGRFPPMSAAGTAPISLKLATSASSQPSRPVDSRPVHLKKSGAP